MYAMSTGLLLNKGNITKEGNATIVDPMTGRPIYIGEGFVPQIEAAANKYSYNGKPNLHMIQLMMSHLTDKCQDETGNHWAFVVNRKFFSDINTVLSEYLADHRTDGTYLYSKSANKGDGGYVKVGATYNSYEFGGNVVTFIPDRALTREYPDKGYGILVDLTHDKTTGKPALAKYSLTGKDVIVNTISGVGGLDGKTSGAVASNVAGSRKVMLGYGCVAAFTPYRSAIIREN
jgi:hypothetical protein